MSNPSKVEISNTTAKRLIAYFNKHPRLGLSQQDSDAQFAMKHLTALRGNVIQRLGGVLDENTRNTYLKAASVTAEAHKKFNGDVSSILKELEKL